MKIEIIKLMLKIAYLHPLRISKYMAYGNLTFGMMWSSTSIAEIFCGI